ncbi:MAG: 4-alpha-glucanotransferase [Clostridiales bacterium]|nr:4-alpha-glucanotransferase [Clostridiales bacterium]
MERGFGGLGFSRSAGILLPVSSLPSPYGIGTFGTSAREWIDFLHEAKQSYWQILPLSPTGFGDSPYQGLSAFAGNPYFIDLDILCEDGLLERADFEDIKWGVSDCEVNYSIVYNNRECVLRKAFSRFEDEAALGGFVADNHWFAEYGLFMALKKVQGQRSWLEWDEPLRLRQADALLLAQEEFKDDIRYHAFVQYMFHKQWRALRDYANAKGIGIIGDAPIYVSLDSADVWANHELFQLDGNAVPIEVSGCPPDGFSETGQVWGNPLYDWDFVAKTGYEWWLKRVKSDFDFFDVLRIDHFRGLESYYAVPYGASDASGGRWKPGPGIGFIDAIKQAMPDARIIAEDLGFLTDDVHKLLVASGYPGMKLIQFAFDSRADDNDSPDTYEENLVVYTGTHDNETLKGWCKDAPKDSVKSAMKYLGVRWRKSLLPLKMTELAMGCKANLVIIPMQDWLGLGNEARINTPSTTGGNNWRWRLGGKWLEDARRSRIDEIIADITEASKR